MYPIHSFDTVASTNALAKKLAENGTPHGTAVTAANQTDGREKRPTLGKTWHSVADKGLYCSIIVRPKLSSEGFPEDLRGKVTSLFLQTGICPDTSQVFLSLRDEILQQLERFSNDGFQPILAARKRRDILLGKHIECVGSEGKIIAGCPWGQMTKDDFTLRIEMADAQSSVRWYQASWEKIKNLVDDLRASTRFLKSRKAPISIDNTPVYTGHR